MICWNRPRFQNSKKLIETGVFFFFWSELKQVLDHALVNSKMISKLDQLLSQQVVFFPYFICNHVKRNIPRSDFVVERILEWNDEDIMIVIVFGFLIHCNSFMIILPLLCHCLFSGYIIMGKPRYDIFQTSA